MVHPKYKRYTDYCCCTGTVHCRYCEGQGKPPHLTVDKDFNTVLITKEPINELEIEINMNTKLTTQTSFIEQIKTKQDHAFIVGSVDQYGVLSFSQNPAVHYTPSDARLECKRLARLTPGKLYIFARLDGGEMVPTASTISI